MKRFSLRSVFFFVAIAAVAFTAYRASLDWYDWFQRPELTTWVHKTFGEITLASKTSKGMRLYYYDDSSGRTHVISNTEFTMNPGGSVTRTGTTTEAEKIWVWPPGAWAATPEQAIELFKNNS